MRPSSAGTASSQRCPASSCAAAIFTMASNKTPVTRGNQGATTVTAAAGHLAMLSHPAEVAGLIERAAASR